MPVKLLAQCPSPNLQSTDAYQRNILSLLSDFTTQTHDAGIECCFGLELKVAYRLEAVSSKSRDERRPPFRQILLRPAIEPILLSFSDSFAGGFDPDTIDRFVACVHGIPLDRRTSDCRITPNEHGNWVHFPAPEYAGGYAERLAEKLPGIDGPINKAGYCYAEIILSHPYMDGNGRLARCAALACLARELDGKLPLLPLGAAFYSNAMRMAEALQTLAVTANWPYFMQAFEALLTDSLRLAYWVMSNSSAANAQQ